MKKLSFKNIIVLCTTVMIVVTIQGCDRDKMLADSKQAEAVYYKQYETETQQQLNKTDGLEGCVIKRINELKIIRCPSSETTVQYQCGKNCTQNITTTE